MEGDKTMANDRQEKGNIGQESVPTQLAVINEKITDMKTVIYEKITDMKKDIEEIKDKIESGYVTRHEFQPIKDNYVSKLEFDPVKKLVYWTLLLILGTVIGGIIKFFFLKGI